MRDTKLYICEGCLRKFDENNILLVEKKSVIFHKIYVCDACFDSDIHANPIKHAKRVKGKTN